MSSFVNLMANDVWMEAAILSHVRSLVESNVSVARQGELQTIMLGHIAGMRTATAEELKEIGFVASLIEQGAALAAEARTDMSLLLTVMAVEKAHKRLALAQVAEVLADTDPVSTLNQAELDVDATERVEAQALVDGASTAANALYLLRNPEPVVEEVAL